MNIAENKYHSTIKVEFKDLVKNLLFSERTKFHMYTIHRLLSLGLLIDFPFQYIKTQEPDKSVGVELDLKEHGKVTFLVNLESNYGSLASGQCEATLQQFLENFDTSLEFVEESKGRKFF